MRVLVACEFSGVVRDAFRARGHDAWSFDLLECERGEKYHLVGDVRNELRSNHGWDLMIAHPPCTYLCNSGVRWLYRDGRAENGRNAERWQAMEEAAAFSRWLLDAPIEHIALESPVEHGYAQELIRFPYTQTIQPHEYGHGETKATCLRLKNLPKLQPTKIVEGRQPRVHHASPGPDRWKERSRTLPGIAAAMAAQWGSL